RADDRHLVPAGAAAAHRRRALTSWPPRRLPRVPDGEGPLLAEEGAPGRGGGARSGGHRRGTRGRRGPAAVVLAAGRVGAAGGLARPRRQPPGGEDAARRGRLVRGLHAHAARAIRGVAAEPAQGCRGHPGRPRRPEHPARAADRAARRGARDPPEGRPRPGPPRGAGDRGRPAPVPVPALDDRGGEQGAAHAELFFLPEPDARWHADPRQPAHVPHRAAATLPPCPVPARTGVAAAADLRAPHLGRGARRRARATPAPDGLQPARHRHARGGAGRRALEDSEGGLRPPSEASPQRIDCAGEAGARTPPFCDRAAATSPRPTLESRPRWYSARMPSIADTVVEMVQWVFPEHAGAPGQIHGGRMMEWITQAGTLAAVRVARGHVVLGAMDDIDFLHPVRVGQIAILRAQVEYVGTSSLEVGVRVWAEDVATGARAVTLNSHLVFVKMGDDVRPRRVPAEIEPEDEAE